MPPPTARPAPYTSFPSKQDVTPSAEGIESLLSGDSLSRYRSLPPEFQKALDSYAWFGVPPDLIPLAARDKMDQWGEAAIPLAEIIGEERAEAFRDTGPPQSTYRLSNNVQVRHADLLLSGYVYLLALEPSDERRLELMREMAKVPSAPAPDSLTWLDPPPDDAVLTKTALAQLERLGPRLRQGLFDAQLTVNDGRRNSRDMAQWLTRLEMFLLKVEPGVEVPSIEYHLRGGSLEAYEALSPKGRALAANTFQGGIIVTGVVSVAVLQGSAAIPVGTFDEETFFWYGKSLEEQARYAIEWAKVRQRANEVLRKVGESP